MGFHARSCCEEVVCMNTEAFIEMAKEGMRIVVFAGASALIQWLLDIVVPGLEPQYAVYTPILTFGLRLADKYIHENEDSEKNGLTFF